MSAIFKLSRMNVLLLVSAFLHFPFNDYSFALAVVPSLTYQPHLRASLTVEPTRPQPRRLSPGDSPHSYYTAEQCAFRYKAGTPFLLTHP